jgi:hypothetical protein
MKAEEVTDTIAKFFNDLIGAWVPGAVLTFGLALMHLGPVHLLSIFKLGDTTSAALAFTGILFALGHTLLALHEQVLKTPLTKLGLVMEFDEAKAKKRQSYEWFSELVKAQQNGAGAKDWDYNDLCSVALSVSPEAGSMGRRFMFISLLCNGVGVALTIIALDFAVCSMLWPKLLFAYDHSAPWGLQVALMLGVAWALFRRGEAFLSRAKATPFAIAAAYASGESILNSGLGPRMLVST